MCIFDEGLFDILLSNSFIDDHSILRYSISSLSSFFASLKRKPSFVCSKRK